MKKNIIIYGLIAGVIVTVWMVAGMAGAFGNPCDESTGSMVLGFTTMIVAFSLIFVAVKNYRDKQNGGVISFGKAFQIGLMISLIASTIYVIVWMIDFYNFIPDFYDRYTAHVIGKMKTDGASASAIAAKTIAMHNEGILYKKPYYIMIYTYMEILPVGLIVTLICALILKRKQPKGDFAIANA